MSNYEIGRNKPPKHTQFKNGNRANPNGRGAKQGLRAGKIYDDVINGVVETSEGGRKKRIKRTEYRVKALALEAAKGKISSAELLLDLYNHSKMHGDYKHKPVAVKAWEKKAQWKSGKIVYDPSMSAIEAAEIYRRLLEEL
jgi:hypothetical protein